MKQILFIFILALNFSLVAHAEFKVAVVDMQKALQSVEAGKKAKQALEKEFNDKKKKLEVEEEAIKKMTEEFKKQSLVLSEAAKVKKQNEIQERVGKYRELFGKSQMDIQNRERQLTEPLILKLRGIIEHIGAEKGFSLILEKGENNVLFSRDGDDITEEVVKQFNSKNG